MVNLNKQSLMDDEIRSSLLINSDTLKEDVRSIEVIVIVIALFFRVKKLLIKFSSFFKLRWRAK